MRRGGMLLVVASLSAACNSEERARRAETDRVIAEVRELAAASQARQRISEQGEAGTALYGADRVGRDSSVEDGSQWLHAVVTVDSTLKVAIRCQDTRPGAIAILAAPRPRTRPSPRLRIGRSEISDFVSGLGALSGSLDSIAGPALGRGDTLTLTYTDTAGRALVRQVVRPFGDRISPADWRLCR